MAHLYPQAEADNIGLSIKPWNWPSKPANRFSDDVQSLLQSRGSGSIVSLAMDHVFIETNCVRWARMQEQEKHSPPQFMSTHPSVRPTNSYMDG